MKILRLDTIASQRPESDPLDVIQEDFEREATIWNMARDFRILPLYGYAFIDDIPALISPYYSRGNAVEYLARDPDAERKGIVSFCKASGSLPRLDTLQGVRLCPSGLLSPFDGHCSWRFANGMLFSLLLPDLK